VDRHYRVVVAEPNGDHAAAGGARPADILARQLRDAGIEVIFAGAGLGPSEVAEAALQEDADAVALAVLPGCSPAGWPATVEAFAAAVAAALAQREMDAVAVAVGDGHDPHFLGRLHLD